MDFTHILNLAANAAPAEGGILSRTIFQDDQVKVVLFGFGAGEELTEHTSTRSAMIVFISGQGTVGLGPESRPFQAGTWIHMPANLKHAVYAHEPSVMLLILLKS